MGRRVFGMAAIATAVVVIVAIVADQRNDYLHTVDFFPAAVLGLAVVALVVIWFSAAATWAWLSIRQGDAKPGR